MRLPPPCPPTPTSRIGGASSTTATPSSSSTRTDAVTDGDSLIHFRRADVIVAGDIFTTTQYPVIDLKNGGSVQGEIRALNEILEDDGLPAPGRRRHLRRAGPRVSRATSTRWSSTATWSSIVRDRVKAMIDAGATLAQVKAARVTADYDTQYGANTGPWTTEMFVTAVYDSLKSGR